MRLPEYLRNQYSLIWISVFCGLTQFCACGRVQSIPGADEGQANGSRENSEVAAYSAGELQIEVTGHEFQWQYRYPGRDRRLGTADDRLTNSQPHLPAQTRTTLILKSRDYLYTYAIPQFEKNEIAVPDMTFSIDFVTADPGELEFRGDQFCGYSHPQLSGQLVVETTAEFSRWLDSLDAPPELSN